MSVFLQSSAQKSNLDFFDISQYKSRIQERQTPKSKPQLSSFQSKNDLNSSSKKYEQSITKSYPYSYLHMYLGRLRRSTIFNLNFETTLFRS